MKNFLGPNDADMYGFHGHFHDGRSAVEYYNKKITERRKNNPLPVKVTEQGEQLRELGHSKVKGFFDKKQREILLNIKGEILNCIETKTNLKYPSENMIYIDDPIINLTSLYEILLDDRIINIATDYYGCLPAIGSLAVRKSFVNNSAPISNQNFHRDYNSMVKNLKFAFYLNDVDEEGGPFTYVENSHKKMFNGWWNHHYLPDTAIEKIYGKESIKYLTADVGDLLIADTRGFHKGQKPKNKERIALHFTYLIHPELCGPGHLQETPEEKRFKIKKEHYESLPDWKKPVCDFLQKV